jgi:hypothetical protein
MLGKTVALFSVLALSLYLVPWACQAEDRPHLDPVSKITFALDRLNQDGLYGPPDGLRALDYEFCIPGDAAYATQVREIDPTIQIFPKSRGRSGCAPGEYLCVGNTQQPNFKAVLFRLASLPYVKRIDQAFFE